MAAVIRVPELDVREMNLQRSRDRWEREAARRHARENDKRPQGSSCD